VARLLERSLAKQGIAIHTGTKCEDIRVTDTGVKLKLVKDGKTEEIEADALLQAVGVGAYTEGLFGPRVKPELDRGYLKVGDDYRTSVPGLYAAGDIIGPPWLAHVATFEAVNAVNGMFGAAKPERVKLFPGCTYCHPQVASIGLTEKGAQAKKLEYGSQVPVHRRPAVRSLRAIPRVS
jgi:dihydrolipoamide dehydrogenase